MNKPRLILAEDYADLREEYVGHLLRVGFDVTAVRDGRIFYETLLKNKFDLIVSDSDMPYLCGDGVCQRALEKGIIDNNVLIVAMSDTEDNQKHWRGIVNHGCFYNKANLTEGRIGEKVWSCWRLFSVQGGIYREKMPNFDMSEWEY